MLWRKKYGGREMESREVSERTYFFKDGQGNLRKLTFKQRLEGNEGASHMSILKKNCSRERKPV